MNKQDADSTGYFDLQINGYAGVDFNSDHLTAESLHKACAVLRRDGVAGALATVITDDPDIMEARLQRLGELRAADPCIAQVIWGLHVEGPFINPDPGFAGAHPVDAVQPASVPVMQKLLDAGQGLVKLVTLAPECDPDLTVTQMLTEAGIIVGAGHSDATLDQLDHAVDAGLQLFTHLGNGCPIKLNRHDNIVQRVLNVAGRRELWVSFIADGAHVPLPALSNYLRLVPPERCIVVSDAIAAAGLGPGRYTLGRQVVNIGEDRTPRAADGAHLAGSATPIKSMVENLRDGLGLPEAQITALTQTNPRRLMRMTGPADASDQAWSAEESCFEGEPASAGRSNRR